MGIIFNNRPALCRPSDGCHLINTLRNDGRYNSHEQYPQNKEKVHQHPYLIARGDILQQEGIHGQNNDYTTFLEDTSEWEENPIKSSINSPNHMLRCRVLRRQRIHEQNIAHPQFLENMPKYVVEQENLIDSSKEIKKQNNEYPQFKLGEENVIETPTDFPNHILGRIDSRRRCVKCYSMIAQKYGRQEAQRKSPNVKWYCDQCRKTFCVSCFKNIHKSSKL
jgi:hypothetical protein